ncbi:unnamed protein product [Sphagnum compactum]
MREIKDVQLDIEQRSSNVHEHTQRTSSLPQIMRQKMVNVFSNLSIAMCHAFVKEHAHMPLVVDLPSDDSKSNELLDDQIEEAINIQPNDNMF